MVGAGGDAEQTPTHVCTRGIWASLCASVTREVGTGGEMRPASNGGRPEAIGLLS